MNLFVALRTMLHIHIGERPGDESPKKMPESGPNEETDQEEENRVHMAARTQTKMRSCWVSPAKEWILYCPS
jgi:hypothetical protein